MAEVNFNSIRKMEVKDTTKTENKVEKTYKVKFQIKNRIKVADYIIDLGPEGGDEGGEVVVCGTPEEVAKCKKSYTGKFLKDKLKK